MLDSDHIRFACRCGQVMVVPAAMAGKNGKCQKCGARMTVPGEFGEDGAAPASDEGFGVYWPAWLCCFVVAALIIFSRGRYGAHQAGYATGSAVGLIIGAFIVSLVAFYALGRSRAAATAGCIIALVIGTIGTLASQTGTPLPQAITSALHDADRRIGGQVSSDRPDPDKILGAASDAATSLDEAASKMTGEDAACARIASNVLKRMAEASDACRMAMGDVAAKSPFAPKSMQSRSDLARCRDAIDHAKAQCHKTREFFASLETDVAAALRMANVSSGKSQTLIAELFGNARQSMPRTIAVLDQNERALDILTKAVNLLDENWHQWSYSGGQVHFESKDTLRTFTDLQEQLKAVAEEQTRLRRQMAESHRP